jgi:hypothetical protein
MKLHEFALSALFFLASADAARAQTPTPEATKAPTSYVRAKEGGAKLRNVFDVKGETVLDAPSGTLFAVYSERAGWLEVEPATGMKVWIHGSFMKKTSTPGVAEITANSVRMRPLPTSDEKSFPLPMKLDKGERVRVIARADAQKPLAEDWVQVWSPAGARAYVASAEVTPLAAGEDARKLWGAAVATSQSDKLVVDLGADNGAGKASAAGSVAATEAAAKKAEPKAHAAVDKLANAEKLMTAARAAENPDFGPAKSAYQAVIAEAPTGASASTAQLRLDEIGIREEIQRLKVEKTNFEKERVEKLAAAEAKLREVNKRHDPLWGRFQARGWLASEVKPGELPRYVLRWGGQDVADVVCGSERYNLAQYVGYEIGVVGVTQRAAVPGTAEAPGTPARIDATRIEVISAHLGG